MDRRQDRYGIGDRVRDAVQEAVESGNFGQLNEIVRDTAGAALEEFRYQAGQIQERFSAWNQPEERPPEVQRAQAVKRLSKQYLNKKGKAEGILFAVFGSIGVGIFGILTFFFLVGLFVVPGGGALAAAVFFALAAASCGGLLKTGRGIQERLKRAERYLELMQGERHVELQNLAARAGQNLAGLRKDLKKMLKSGIFPQGHMDAEEKLFVLDDVTWGHYLDVRRQWEETQKTASVFSKEEGVPEEKKMEQEGRAFVDRLRQLNKEIPGEAISGRLYRLDDVLQRIFRVLREHPEQCPRMQKFMDYYLPTTVRLAESYVDFEKAGVQSKQVQSAKAEIEKTMDTINQAFERLLEDLYQEEAFEAAADAKVLKTILAQDGYTENEFAADAEEEGKDK